MYLTRDDPPAMSGPYHVHEGSALESTSGLAGRLFQKGKAYAKGTSTKGTFPVAKFLNEGKMSFKTTNFASKEIEGMYKVFNAADETSTFYRIKIKNLGSELMYSDQFKAIKEQTYSHPKNDPAPPDRYEREIDEMNER